jgi:UPF0716 protein FxsA
MFRLLFFVFVLVPIIEITVLVHVGEWLGPWTTVGIVIITAWLGAQNVRQQGINTLKSVQEKANRGEAPSDEIIAGFLLLVAGILLVTPGFVTDTFGLLLLVPAFRGGLINKVKTQIAKRPQAQSPFGFSTGGHLHGGEHSEQHSTHSANDPFDSATTDKSVNKAKQGDVLEGEFERKD